MNTGQARPSTIILACAITAALSLVLSACGIPMAYTPEEAAIRDITSTSRGRGEAQIDPNSIQVLQSTVLGDRTFVLVSYGGVRPDLGMVKATCLGLYEMRKRFLGMWAPSSASSGCESTVQVSGEAPEEPAQQAISIGGSRSGGDGRNDPGTSTVSGLVNDDAVKAVKVTWQDATSQQVDVINASYVVARTGQVEMLKVEALNEKGDVVYTWKPEVAPGKQ